MALYKLVDKEGHEVNIGDKVTSFRGEEAVLLATYPPKHEASSGHIDTSLSTYVYAGVYNLKFIQQ